MKQIFVLALISFFLFACTNASTSTTKTDKDSTMKKDSTLKDSTNPNAPAATNAQY
jgi:outer membrane biogenesis lipoprotein LolB